MFLLLCLIKHYNPKTKIPKESVNFIYFFFTPRFQACFYHIHIRVVTKSEKKVNEV